jgi:hypothetical protein
MRIIEAGLHAIHARLGITVALVGNERNWGSILGRIKTTVSALPKGPEKDRFQENYALLDSVKDAWRNNTMHVALKYTPDEVERIYLTVKGFMMNLSERMDEDGKAVP